MAVAAEAAELVVVAELARPVGLAQVVVLAEAPVPVPVPVPAQARARRARERARARVQAPQREQEWARLARREPRRRAATAAGPLVAADLRQQAKRVPTGVPDPVDALLSGRERRSLQTRRFSSRYLRS